MRVIAGSLGGRIFSSPGGHRTHPMSDKMRGALFNSLGDISGMHVLDPFAGSGALSFEAVSRGAAHATAIERDRNAVQTLQKNINDLQLEDTVTLVRSNAAGWLRTTKASQQFDLLLLDPPYDQLQYELLDKLINVVKPDGVIVVSWPGKMEAPRIAGVELMRHKNYGDASLYYFAVAG